MTADLQTQGPQATAICDKWVAKLGYGFHPDTRGRDYRPRLTPMEVIAYDHDMMRLFGLDILDPYLYAVAALKDWEARHNGVWHCPTCSHANLDEERKCHDCGEAHP